MHCSKIVQRSSGPARRFPRRIFPYILMAALSSSRAFAITTLPVVYHYADAEKADWSKTKMDEVPGSLIEQVKMDNPSRAFQAPHPLVFFQNDRVVVCYESCSSKKHFRPKSKGPHFEVPFSNTSHLQNLKAQDLKVLKQATTYFWINRYFDYLEGLGFQPKGRLTVIVDSPEELFTSYHNASFLPSEREIRLPKQKIPPLLSLLKVKTLGLKSAALDPSVILHEAGHSVFHDLISRDDIGERGGINEGIADYFSLSLLNHPNFALIMNGGKEQRSLESGAAYRKGLESHELGEVIASILWEIRDRIGNRTLSDMAVLETLRKLETTPTDGISDLIQMHQTALQEIAPQFRLRMPGLLEAASQVWSDFGVHLVVPVEGEVLPKRVPQEVSVKRSKRVAFDIIDDFQLEGDWFNFQSTLHLITSSPHQESKGTRWYYTALEERRVEWEWYKSQSETETPAPSRKFQFQEVSTLYPAWVLFSHPDHAVLGVYGVDRNFISNSISTARAPLNMHSRFFPRLMTWLQDFGAKNASMISNREESRLFKRSFYSVPTEYVINGQAVKGVNYCVDQTQKRKWKAMNWLSRKLGHFNLSDFFAVSGLKNFCFHTVRAEDYDFQGLVELSPGNSIVGYTKSLNDGSTESILLSEFEDQYDGRPLGRREAISQSPSEGELGMRLIQEPKTGTIKVLEVKKGSPAAEAGIQVDDILLEINDVRIEGMRINPVLLKLKGHEDEPVQFKLRRKDQEILVSPVRVPKELDLERLLGFGGPRWI